VVRGWRVWYVRPREEPLRLYSPQVRPGAGRIPSVGARVLRASCPLANHEPPAPGCRCGVYACVNLIDAAWRLRAMADGRRRVDDETIPSADRDAVLVLAAVTLERAVRHNDSGYSVFLGPDGYVRLGRHLDVEVDNQGRRIYRLDEVAVPVLRAAAATITRLHVPDQPPVKAERIAQRLAARFGVEAMPGWPDYTPAEWDSRPEWLRGEPWRARYRVDELLAGFTPGGYRPVDGEAAASPRRRLHIVFVCTNNICRSAMAEKMFTHEIRARGLDSHVRVSSAGTFDGRPGRYHIGAEMMAPCRQILESRQIPTGHSASCNSQTGCERRGER